MIKTWQERSLTLPSKTLTISTETFALMQAEIEELRAENYKLAVRVGELLGNEAELAAIKGQEPVAFDVMCEGCGGDGFDSKDSNYFCSTCGGSGFVEKNLYLAAEAQERKPLTDDEIYEATGIYPTMNPTAAAEVVEVARAIEAKLKERNQ